ncbi:hydroxymethylglutaryl-CoA lyase [Effusibacillus lacus]|uniref:Hydroxymethylglutaryl-CoA lyase n=1 Tax=Effusibacillus lacus TaxID=1348429 RepID=A0A292YMY6_9BACL|nr:hydroxymethylglutaryl-CoA lyase [Effusibacillus lacus]TCS72252.1 hydroxymethylglutaryl-CoA lyase [Effusibacillus lacus]GAX90271.1 hydroxymethylglutaryl-CoA lyase [Effusibacillus lacus]
MIFPKSVEIVEVGPRDGLQNEPVLIPTEKKIELIDKLKKTGIQRMETAAFVHPKWVPQMADSEQIAEYCREMNYIALTPNLKALDRAIAAKTPQIAVFIGASSAFNQKNINKTTDESLQECEALFAKAQENGMFIRAYVSMAFSCPYQGEVTFEEVLHVCQRFVKLGADEIDIGDTNGHANPRIVYERFAKLRDLFPDTVFVAHFHDTRKMALANVVAAMQAGVDKFDSSVGGLGGCPYSPGATGNLATEDVVLMCNDMGIETGIDFEKLKEAATFARQLSTRL